MPSPKIKKQKPFAIFYWRSHFSDELPAKWIRWNNYTTRAAAETAIAVLRRNFMYNGGSLKNGAHTEAETDANWVIRTAEEGPPTAPPE